MVFRYIREILRHVRIQDGEESVHASGEVIHLILQRIVFLTGELIAALAEANGYAAAYQFSPVPNAVERFTITSSFGR